MSWSCGTTRLATGAGRWFPGDACELRVRLNEYIDVHNEGPVGGSVVSAIAPHAGYDYSGPTAGRVFRAIRDMNDTQVPTTVVALGSSHRISFPGVALMDGDCIETPLGPVTIDREGTEFLTSGAERAIIDYTPHQGEHSVENLVPFVQAALPGARVVLGLCGDHVPDTVTEFVGRLVALSEERPIVVVASSDMLHDPDYDLVTETDTATLKLVSDMDSARLSRCWLPQKQVFCGIAPVLMAIDYARAMGCVSGTVLHYCNSGDIDPSGRGNWVVGYSAVVFMAPVGPSRT